MTEYIILGFLMNRSMTGYDIKQMMNISTSNFMEGSFGSIYPALKKLEQKGLIFSEEITSKGKLKKVYTIKEQGKEEFIKWVGSPIEASKTSITSALSKIFFFRSLPEPQAAELINQYIKNVKSYKSNLLEVKEKVCRVADTYEVSTLEFGIDFYDFIINWYENYLNKMNKVNERK